MSRYSENIEEGLKVGDKVIGDYSGEERKNLHVTYVHHSGKVKLADENGVVQPNFRNPENLKKITEDVPATSTANAPHTQTEPFSGKSGASSYKKRNLNSGDGVARRKTFKEFRETINNTVVNN